MLLKGVRTPVFLLEIVMNVLSAPAALSLFIAIDEFVGFQMIALSTFILLMSFIDEPAKCVCALSETNVLDI